MNIRNEITGGRSDNNNVRATTSWCHNIIAFWGRVNLVMEERKILSGALEHLEIKLKKFSSESAI